MSVILKGLKDIQRTIKAIADAFPDKAAAALYQEAQIEMTESKRRCPVKTGALRASGRVAEPERGPGNSLSVTLSYGTEYAIFVHENLEAFHPVGQAKFLESVINESRPFMAARVAKRIQMKDVLK